MLFDLLSTDPVVWLARILALVIAFTVHEFAHAWTAAQFGDNTPEMYGRLTLNPLAHLDPMGSLLLLVGGFGWAKPVPVNPYAVSRKHPSAMMWVAMAGPLSNFAMAILAAIPIRLGWVYMKWFDPTGNQFVGNLLLQFVYINIGLMLFNLLPISPLDGEKVAQYFFPPSWARVLDNIRPYGPIILMALIATGITSLLITPTFSALLLLLLGY